MTGIAMLGLATCVLATENPAWSFYSKPSWYVGVFGGRSARILGSQDVRGNYGFNIAWSKAEPHFKWRHGPSQLVLEGYYEHSEGHAYQAQRGAVTNAIGAIWYARFRFPRKGFSLYLDIGEGAQISSSESHDLGTRLNSSPMFGVGFAIRQGSQETLVGIRYLHLSNAGLNARNNGQNQLLATVSVKF